MTPDALAAAVEAADVPLVVELLRGASEADRRAAASRARQLQRRWADLALGSGDAHEAAMLAVYGTATASELRKAPGRASWPPRHHEVDVLMGRPAEVVALIIEWQLEHFWGFGYARELVRLGIISPPVTNWYLFRLIDHRGSASDLLAQDPGLLDHEVWRLFEVEGSGEFSLAARDKYVRAEDTWQAALVGVAAENAAIRQRLLDASLNALALDFATFRAGWFSRFHEALDPTLDERADRADRYARLLRSQVKPTLGLAIRALNEIQMHDRLDADLVVGRTGGLLAFAPVATSRATLKLLERVAVRHPARRTAVAADALEALANESADVQAAAIDLVDSMVVGPDPAVRRRLEAQMGSVAASVVPAATALLERLGGQRPRVARPGETRERAPEGNLGPTDESRVVDRVEGLVELIHLLASLIERIDTPDDVERGLDGLARLGHRLDDDRLVAPLRKRAVTVLGRQLGDRQNSDLRHDIAALVLSWTDRELVTPPRLLSDVPTSRGGGFWLGPRNASYEARADRFLGLRLLGIARAVARRRPLDLLATPTHAGGWIVPRVLVERLAAASPADIDELDLIGALLRIAPDGRDEALRMARGLPGEAGAALRHALGGGERIGPTAPLWAAAARARAPNDDDARVAQRHPELPPNGGRAARVRFVTGDWMEVPGRLDLIIDPPMPVDGLRDDLPATTLLVSPFPGGVDAAGDPAMCRWVGTIWPAGTEAWAAVGTTAIGRNLDWWSADWTNRIHLEAFLRPWAALGPMGRMLLGVAIGAKERGERGLAADVAIAAISDGRLDGKGLADALSGVVDLGLARPRRWAISLADVAAISDRHARVVLEGVAGVLGVLSDAKPADLVPLVRLVRELVHDGRPFPASARDVLAALPGRGELRRLADAILASASQTGTL